MDEFEGLHYQFAHGGSFQEPTWKMKDPELYLNSASMIVNADTDSGPASIGWIVMWVGEPPGEWKTVDVDDEGRGLREVKGFQVFSPME